MQIGKAGAAESHICQAYPDRVEVHGLDLCRDLMGQMSFTGYFHLLLTGRKASETQQEFLDLLLVAIAEHGMMPTSVAARMTLAADPGSLQGALAAGLLGCGPVILGTSELCAKLLAEAQAKVLAGGVGKSVTEKMARDIKSSGGKAPGFGHPVHRPLDPRAERILEMADKRSISGPHVALARDFRDAVAKAWGKPLVMNVSMPMAAVLLDLGLPVSVVKAVPLLARTAGILGHLAEEQKNPIGFLMAGKAEEAITYRHDQPEAKA
jgi:citrate synthase